MPNADLMAELLPCPFCGGEAAINNCMGEHYAACMDCEIQMPLAETSVLAAEQWNTRTHHAEIEAMARDVLTERAIQNAARDLPEGYVIAIYVENGSGYIDLTDDDGDVVLIDTDDRTMAEQINEATRKAAMHDSARENGK